LVHLDHDLKSLNGFCPIRRIEDLGEIPSPYLTGQMDPWFGGAYEPAIQTVRGCPFQCGYCRAGNVEYNPIRRFDLERVKEPVA
jgi:radical SAM superfamily enzyme YgiQ (UPF0313 family)